MEVSARQPETPPDAAVATRPSAGIGAAVGVISMVAGLAVAEFVAAIPKGSVSPVVEVGNRVVDLVPKFLRDWAISAFGTSDKLVLLACVVAILVVVAAVVGRLAVGGRRTVAIAVLVGVSVVGALAPLGRGGGGWVSVLAAVVGTAVSVAVLIWLSGLATAAYGGPQATPASANTAQPTFAPESSGDPSSADPAPRVVQPMVVPGSGVSRRRFVGTAAGVAVAATAVGAASVWLRSRTTVTAERLGIRLPKAAQPLPAIPSGVSVGVDGVSPFITPNDDFYRIDTAFLVPKVTTEDWTMRVHGRVDHEITLDYEQLLDRPLIELDATIACVSNLVGGDLVGTARWLGCRLDDLLAEAGIDPSADQIVGRSVDGFTAGFPTAVLDGRDAIVAVGMNGEPLPTDHGYPARLIVPGLYGYVSATKWLSEIELTRFDEFDGYWIPRGWDRFGPVLTQSRIDTPESRSTVTAGEELAIGGVAWAMTRTVTDVEVQVDDGPWTAAELGDAFADTTWRQWGFTFTPETGEHTISVRATDSDGETQTAEESIPGPGGATGHHTITVTAS